MKGSTQPHSPTAGPHSGAALPFAWTGAAMFVASLGVFLYSYGFTYGHPVMTSRPGAVAIDILLFSVFALHHSILARPGAKRLVARAVSPALERSLFTWVSSVLFLIVCLEWQPLAGEWYRLARGWRVAGYAAQAAGLWLTFAGSAALDVLDLAGVRPVLNARTGAVSRHVPLKTDGVYAIVRHPLYLGWALFVFGAPDMTATRFVFACVSSLYLVVAIGFEERSLLDVFGDDYRQYQRKVRWRMIPGLY